MSCRPRRTCKMGAPVQKQAAKYRPATYKQPINNRPATYKRAYTAVEWPKYNPENSRVINYYSIRIRLLKFSTETHYDKLCMGAVYGYLRPKTKVKCEVLGYLANNNNKQQPANNLQQPATTCNNQATMLCLE